MAKRRQVGGTQEVFIQVSAKSLTGTERAIKAVEKAGGRILHAFPPAVLVADVPAGKVAGLVGVAGITAADTGAIGGKALKAADPQVSFAIGAWNDHVNAERRLRALGSLELNRAWDVGDRLPPDPPAEVLAQLRRREAKLAPQKALKALAPGAPNMSIPVLLGRVAVGLVFVDSTVQQFAITDQERSKVVSETVEGLNMLAGFEPRANIQWFYDLKRPQISLAANAFTAANKDHWEDLWRNAAMAALGYAATSNGMSAYINAIKAANNAQHAYAIYVTKYPKDWFAYEWFNHVVMDFGVDNWGLDNFNLVVAHETGHVFGCGDEYAASGCNCTDTFGRYRVVNGNCESCAPNAVACLMSRNAQTICDFSRGQLGWNELAVQSKGTTTLKGTWTFDFDTGKQGPAGGADIWWEQIDKVKRLLVPQSGALLAHMGKPNFAAVSLPTLKAQSYTATPINGSNNTKNQLTAGTVIAIKTSAGRYLR
jgi:hypothetical protein